MNIILINNETIHLDELKELLKNHQLKIFSYNEKYNTKNTDLIILSGGAHYSIFNKKHPFKKEINLIQNTDIPIIGICLGAQLIAQAFGSTFGKLSEKLQKNINITHIETGKKILVHEAHRYFINTLGEELEGIYKSKYGREYIKHREKNIYGLQFHPEYKREKTDGIKIFSEIIKEIE